MKSFITRIHTMQWHESITKQQLQNLKLIVRLLLTSLAERAGPNGTSKVDIYALKVFAWDVTDDSLSPGTSPTTASDSLWFLLPDVATSYARAHGTYSRVVKHKHCAQHSCSTLCSRRRSARNGEGGEERESGRE